MSAVAIAGVLATVGAACGDDGGEEGDASGSGSASGSASASASGPEEETTTTTEGAGDEESSGEVDFENLGECLEIAGAYASLGFALLGGALGGGEDVDVAEVISQVEEVAGEAPGDVRGAFEEVIAAYEEVFDNLGGDLSALDFTDPDVAEAFEPLESDDFVEADRVVQAYFEEICG